MRPRAVEKSLYTPTPVVPPSGKGEGSSEDAVRRYGSERGPQAILDHFDAHSPHRDSSFQAQEKWALLALWIAVPVSAGMR